jgi:hypothetical protein
MKYQKWLMALIMLGALALFLLAGNAFAGQAVVTWTNPTARTDGSALTAAQIGSTEVEYGTCSGTAFGTATGTSAVTGAGTALTILNLAPGTYCFRARTHDTSNNLSAWSNIASKVVPMAPRNPPVLVTVSTYAYEFRPRTFGGFKLVRVADVQMGAPCSEIPGLTGAGFGIADGKVAICGPG